ncbi:phage tail sheath family protein [Geodermatophilus sp. URMC 60]
MPVTPTYPGVYIEEIPSGVRTITGVATSVAAFVGYFNRGPLDTPVQLFNIGDFERECGGLARDDETGYGIRQFFNNGGSHAYVVRVASPSLEVPEVPEVPEGSEVPEVPAAVLVPPAAAEATLGADVEGAATPMLRAFAGRQVRGRSVEDPGVWGNEIRITVDYVTRDPVDSALFNMSTSEVASQDGRRVVLRTESFLNCSTDPASSDYVIDKVNAGSRIVQLAPVVPPPEALLRPAQTGTTGIPIPVNDSASFSGDSKLSVTSGGQDDMQEVTLTDLTTDTKFDDNPTLIRRALERGIRAAGVAASDPYLSGATVTLQSRTFRIVAGGFDRADLEGQPVLTFADAGGGNVATDLGLLGGDVVTNVQEYRLGFSAAGYQTGGVAGTSGALPDAAALLGSFDEKTGMHALRDVDLFNILVLPGAVAPHVVDQAPAVYAEALAFCEAERAFLIVDPPADRNEVQEVNDWVDDAGIRHRNAAVYFPRVQVPDPLNDNRLRSIGPSGTMAGVYARTDGERGVWKAPAGLDAVLRNVGGLDVPLTDDENGVLNPKAVNALRQFPIHGRVAWGARTLQGADVQASEWKYIPVRRLTLFLEETLLRGLQWAVFEPNDDSLHAQIRLNVGAFMHNLFRQGAFQGSSPRDAYFVKCDAETTTQNDVDLGIVNVVVGFAPLKPAEFVIIKIQQMAGQIQT